MRINNISVNKEENNFALLFHKVLNVYMYIEININSSLV